MRVRRFSQPLLRLLPLGVCLLSAQADEAIVHPTSVKIGTNELTGITKVSKLTNGKVVMVFSGGGGTFPVAAIPAWFLRAWNISKNEVLNQGISSTPLSTSNNQPNHPELTGQVSVLCNGKTLSGISAVTFLPDLRLIIKHEHGLEAVAYRDLPHDFLNSWGLTRATYEEKQAAAETNKRLAEERFREKETERKEFVKRATPLGLGISLDTLSKGIRASTIDWKVYEFAPFSDPPYLYNSRAPLESKVVFTGPNDNLLLIQMCLRLQVRSANNAQKLNGIMSFAAVLNPDFGQWVDEQMHIAAKTPLDEIYFREEVLGNSVFRFKYKCGGIGNEFIEIQIVSTDYAIKRRNWMAEVAKERLLQTLKSNRERR